MLYEFLPSEIGSGTAARGPHANGSKVMLIPGFMTGDACLYPMAMALRSLGHRTFFSGIWINVDCPRRTIARLSQTLIAAHRGDRRKVVLVGHSLGGIYARELARRFPELIERTVLMGSAIREPLSNSNPFVRMWFMATRRRHREGDSCLDHLSTLCGAHAMEPAPAVEQTIIYSRNDIVVDWRSCLESGSHVEAVEVRAGHNTMPFSPEVLAIVAARLRRAPALAHHSRPHHALAAAAH